MNERNPPSNEWKESTFQLIKEINSLMNESKYPQMNGITPLMNERNQPSNEWKESTLQWMKGIHPPMNQRNEASNEWKKSTL